MSSSPPRSAWLLAALLAGSAAMAQSPLHTDRAAALRLSATVLRIEAPLPQGGFALGSGVMVGTDLVITNCHVTRGSSVLHVVRGGVRWPVTAQVADTALDLCLLRAPGVQASVAALDDTHAPSIGENVIALGYTGGTGLQHSMGTVVGLHRHDDGQVLQTSNGFNSGASGGGLFDGRGRLVGILTFRLRGAEQHYFAAPATWVRRLVARAQAGALQPVAPLDPARLAYWQMQGERQPRFLRAAVLVREQRWTDLAALAQEWLRTNAQDSEPWHLLGLALDQLEQPAASREAFDCALRLQPGLANVAWQLPALPTAPGRRAAPGTLAAAPSGGGSALPGAEPHPPLAHAVSCPATA